MPSYLAYGLGIHSALPLPELTAAEAAEDVVVRLGRVEHLSSEATGTGTCLYATAEEVCLFWEAVGLFMVRRGREIIVDPAPGVEERVLRLFLLGPALAILLHQRGLLTLHASAVAVGRGAVVFLGGPGWGKSTTAAAFYAKGYGIMADDVVAFNSNGAERPTVLPGFPQLKLWPDVVVSLGDVPEALPRLHPRLEKCAFSVTNGFSGVPLPLSRIYVLAEGDRQAVEPLHPQEAFVELVRHSYCARLLPTTGASSHFFQCASFVRDVPVRRLKRSRSLQELPDNVRIVEEDLTHV